MWNKLFGKKNTQQIAEEELRKNKDVIESLRDYDKGEKDISTSNVERHLRDLQPSP